MKSYFDFHANKEFDTINLTNGRSINFRLTGSRSPEKLIISFHGATNRNKRPLPRFQDAPYAGESAAYLSISDPTLEVNNFLRIGWYAGAENFPLRTILSDLLTNTISRLKPKKTILFGSSAGGYAALWYAKILHGLTSFAINPQTNILRYNKSNVDDYVRACWPSLKNPDDLQSVLDCDIGNIYRDNAPKTSTVILSSSGDRRHFENHIAPFIGGMHPDALKSTILMCDYFGVMGHENSIPNSIILRWFKAVLLAENAEPESILLAYSGLVKIDSPRPPYSKNKSSSMLQGVNVVLDPHDLQIANLLRDHHLHQIIQN